MRIAIIAEVFLPKVDGVVNRTINLIRHLRERGDDILVICPESEGRTNFPTPVFQFRSFPFPAYPEYRIGLPDDRLRRVLEEFSPDIVHYINPFAFGFRCCDILAKAGVRRPTVFSFHTLYGEFVKRYPLMKPLSNSLWWLMRDYHNTADRNLTVSSIMRDDLSHLGFERVELWPPAVDCSLFSPSRRDEAMRSRLTDGRPETPLLLTVSRLAPEKNVGFLADVIRRLPGVRLAVVGDGPQRAELERRFLGTNSEFFGYLKGEELAAAYASADAFVYASETETMGNVVLEAMASGLAVVAPRAGGIPSLMSHGETGLLYEPRDTSNALSAVEQLLSQPVFRASVGHAARTAVEAWGWNRSVERVRQHYEETIEKFKSGERVASRKRRFAPAMVQALVLAFRTMALASSFGKARRDRQPAATPVNYGDQILNSHRGLHEHRSEGART